MHHLDDLIHHGTGGVLFGGRSITRRQHNLIRTINIGEAQAGRGESVNAAFNQSFNAMLKLYEALGQRALHNPATVAPSHTHLICW
jgi:hypothetical protein